MASHLSSAITGLYAGLPSGPLVDEEEVAPQVGNERNKHTNQPLLTQDGRQYCVAGKHGAACDALGKPDWFDHADTKQTRIDVKM